MPFEVDGTYLFFLGLTLLFVTAMYLFIRKVILNFRKGIEEGRR